MSKYFRVALTTVPLVLPLVVSPLYFTGVIWEAFYLEQFGFNHGVLGSGFSELLVTGYVAWFSASAKYWFYFIGVSLGILGLFVLVAMLYENKLLKHERNSTELELEAKGRGAVPSQVGTGAKLSSGVVFIAAIFTLVMACTSAFVFITKVGCNR